MQVQITQDAQLGPVVEMLVELVQHHTGSVPMRRRPNLEARD
jgi:hypothetical protein